MKLWVDDMRDAPDDSWTVVRKVQPAIHLLALYVATEISLDHDIENRPDDETFQPIAYYIGEKYGGRNLLRSDVQPPVITIHSVNPVGAKEIHDILRGYGVDSTIAPYAPDIKRIDDIINGTE